LLIIKHLTFIENEMENQGQEKQYFGQVKCRFTARTTRSGLSALYANVTAPTENHYFAVALKVKVKPQHFMNKKQMCLVSNELSGVDNYNNRIANDAIRLFRERIADVNKTISEAENPYSVNVRDIIVPKKPKRVERLDDIFFHIADAQLQRGEISRTAHGRKVSVVKSFVSYYNGDFEGLNTEVYNGYGEWLIKRNKTITTINAYLAAVKALVNDVNRTEKYPFINTQNWGSVYDHRSREEKRSTNIMFTDEEFEKVAAVELPDKLAMVRDLFVLMCNIGQRPADCARILRGEYRLLEYDGCKYIEIIPNKTKKTGCTATIPINDAITELMEKFAVNESYAAFIREPNFDKFATLKLKRIFELAGINKKVEVTEQKGNTKTTSTVSSAVRAHLYLARHYFITKMIRQGIRPDELIKMTGHTNTNMVNDIYTHLSSMDRCSIIKNAFDKITPTA
jgi:integrase